MSVDQLFISKIIEVGEITPALDVNIKPTFFATERGAQAWEWIYGYWSKHKKVPTYDAFRRKFPTYELIEGIEDPLTGLVEELFEDYRDRVVKGGVGDAVKAIDLSAPVDDVLTVIHEIVATVNTELTRSQVEEAKDFIGNLVQQYLSSKEGTMTGIPTGFSIIDEACGGLMPEQLVTILALPKRMKSSFLLWMAMTAMHAGYKVGLVSFEMSNAEQKQRFLSLGAKVNLTHLQRGMLTEQDKAKLHAFEEMILDEVVGKLHLIHDITSTTTVGGLSAKIEQHDFDALFVDGVYLMDDELGEDRGSPQAITNITRSLKRLAQDRKLPIVCTTQALFARTTKRRGVDMNSAGYSSSFAQDSDILIGIDREDLTQPVARLKVIAARNALGTESDVMLDYSTGRVEDRGIVASFDGAGFVSYRGDDDDD